MASTRIPAFVQLNAKLQPVDRGELYEDPLIDALEQNGLGEVTGAGTSLMESGEIEFAGIDVDLFDLDKGVEFVCQFLADQGAPRGSKLSYELDGKTVDVPFGFIEGLGIYLNGADLPDEVYHTSDVNVVIDEVSARLGERGAILATWEGPTETALYLYGPSALEMRGLVADFLGSYPLCQKARLVDIA